MEKASPLRMHWDALTWDVGFASRHCEGEWRALGRADGEHEGMAVNKDTTGRWYPSHTDSSAPCREELISLFNGENGL